MKVYCIGGSSRRQGWAGSTRGHLLRTAQLTCRPADCSCRVPSIPECAPLPRPWSHLLEGHAVWSCRRGCTSHRAGGRRRQEGGCSGRRHGKRQAVGGWHQAAAHDRCGQHSVAGACCQACHCHLGGGAVCCHTAGGRGFEARTDHEACHCCAPGRRRDVDEGCGGPRRACCCKCGGSQAACADHQAAAACCLLASAGDAGDAYRVCTRHASDEGGWARLRF